MTKAVPLDDLPDVVPAGDLPSGVVPADDLPDAGSPAKGPSWWETISAVPGTTLGKMRSSIGGMLQNIAETDWEKVYLEERGMADLAQPDNNPSFRVLAKKTGKTPTELAKEAQQARIEGPIAEWGRELHAEGKKRVEEASPGDLSWESPGEVNFWKAAVLNGGSSLLAQIPGVVASVAARSPAPGVASAMASTYGGTYGESREAGIEPERAGLHSAFDAAVEGVMEFIPLKFMVDAAGGPVLRLIAGTMMREVPTEFYTTALQSANAKLSTRPEMTWEEYAKDLLDTVGATLVSAPLMAGVAAGTQRAMPKGKEQPKEPADLYSPDYQFAPGFAPETGPGLGAEILGISDPNFDFKTNRLEATELKAFEAQRIDPEEISDKQLEDARKVFAEARRAEKTPPLPGAELAWSQLSTAPASPVEDAGELGASSRQAENAPNYVNPNQGDRLDRTITRGPDGFVGLTPRQVLPKPGTYTLGEPSDDRPGDYLEPLHDTMEQWRAKYIPDATLVISNEQMYNNSALGAHYTTGKGKHMIVPAVLRKASKGWAAYNPNTKATAFFNATHEFGHALSSERFYEVADDLEVAAIRDESKQGLVSSEAASKLPAPQQAVVAEFNAMKQRILDESMTAAQFVQEWMGPAKIGRANFLSDLKVSPKAPAKQLVNAIADRAVKESGLTAEDAKAALKQEIVEDFLNIDEYLSEQLSRHAYQKKWDETTPIGKFFGETLRIMRQFFVDRKKDGTIAAGTAFNEWMEGLAKAPRVLEEKIKLKTARTRYAKAPETAPPTGTKFKPKRAAKTKKKVARVQHNVASDSKPARQKQARGLVVSLVRSGVLEQGDPQYKQLMDLAKQGEFSEFIDLFTQLAGKTVKFELDTSSARPERRFKTVEEVMPLLEADPDLWAHFTKAEFVPSIKKEGLRFKGETGINQPGFGGRDFEPHGTSLTRDRDTLDAYVNPERGPREDFKDHEILLVRVKPKKVLDLTQHQIQLRALHEKMGWELDLNNLPDDISDEEFTALETGGEASIAAWRHNQLAMFDVLGDLKESGKALGKEIRDKLIAQGYDAIKYPDELRVIDESAMKVERVSSVTTEFDWPQGKFESPGFKAWFGDWERDPQGSSKVRVAAFIQDRGIISVDNDNIGPPLVLFTTAERLRAGENAFHASTVRGQHYAESLSSISTTDLSAALSLVPVVLNIRNPFIQGDLESPAPDRATLKAQGYDGIVYQNDLDGHLAFIVFDPSQIKQVPDRSPYSRRAGVSLELDHDQSTTSGLGAAKLYRALKDFASNPRLLAKAVRHTLAGSRVGMQMQQMGQMWPDLHNLLYMINSNTGYESYKASRMSMADKVLDYWEDQPSRTHKNVKSYLKAQNESGERWMDLVPTLKMRNGDRVDWYEVAITDKTLAKAKEHGIDPETPYGKEVLQHIRNIENSLLDDLNESEYVIRNLLAHRYKHNQLTLNAAVAVLARDVHEMRLRPFLMKAWFGQFQLVIREKLAGSRAYETVHRQGFDSAEERDKVFERVLRNKTPEQIAQRYELTDTQHVLMGLPKEFLDIVSQELDLEDDQVAKLAEIIHPVKEDRLLKERDLKKLGVSGESEDLMRSYANYTWHHANALAKMLYRKQFNMAIEDQRKDVLALSQTSNPDYYRQFNVLRAMENTREYVLTPPNEWHTARTVVTLSYLWMMPKTALANAFGLMLTWADLTGRHGSLKGEERFLEAFKWTTATVWKDGKLPPDIEKGHARALEQGILNQSMPYHLAGQANASRFYRVLSRHRLVRYGQKAMDAGMFPFRLVELMNRKITFFAALKEGLDAPNANFEEAYQAAVTKTNALQNDYTRGNRVPFMRGQKGFMGGALPMATIFLSFPHHAGFHGLGFYEKGQRRLTRQKIAEGKLPESATPTKFQLLHGHTARLWAMLFVLGGYEGLPFAENFIDFIEWVWRRFGKKPIRQELRELVQSMEMDPHLMARGLMHNVAGFDLSRAVGWGTLFPGTDVLKKSQQSNFDENVGTMAVDLTGVSGAFTKWVFEMSPLSHKPMSEAMKSAPGAMGAIYNAVYWSKYGVRGPAKGIILRDEESGLPRDPNAKELIGKAMGANPTAVSVAREINWAKYDREMFWKTKQDRLKEEVWKGRWQGDGDLEHEAREAIKEFNADLPNEPAFQALRLTDGDVAKYLQYKQRKQKEEEAGQAKNKRFRKLHEDIRESYRSPD